MGGISSAHLLFWGAHPFERYLAATWQPPGSDLAGTCQRPAKSSIYSISNKVKEERGGLAKIFMKISRPRSSNKMGTKNDAGILGGGDFGTRGFWHAGIFARGDFRRGDFGRGVFVLQSAKSYRPSESINTTEN